MIAVIFEATTKEGKMQEYLDMAPKYQEILKEIKGFISNERYQSCTNPDKVLSLSFWEDEESMKQFREVEVHLEDEKIGREYLFKDYRICISKIFRNYGLDERRDAPENYKK